MNVVLREEGKMLVRLMRGFVKVQLGDQGARAGLVFLLDRDPTEEGLMEQLEQYNTWGLDEYEALQSKRYPFVSQDYALETS